MPPRYYKRKFNRYGTRPNKRRRFGRSLQYRVGTPRRTLRRRRKSNIMRRFRRRFRRIRRGRRNGFRKPIVPSKKRLEFKLSETRPIEFSYGQQHTVPDASAEPECVYFTVEATTASAGQTRSELATQPLGCADNVAEIADYLWTVTPSLNQGVPAINQGWITDLLWGDMYLRGHDTHELRNQSNETVRVTAYTCICRQNNFLNPEAATLRQPNIYNLLGYGFAEKGVDQATRTAFNEGLTDATISPFWSRTFTKYFKIKEVKEHRIAPGEILRRSISMKWRRYTPADLFIPTVSTVVQWNSRDKRYQYLKGERFILFKLWGNPAGITEQGSATMKVIGQTTPSVLMRTIRKYEAKHMPRTAAAAVRIATQGNVLPTGTQAIRIIADEDEKALAEFDAT